MDFNKIGVLDIESNDLMSGMIDFSSLPYKLLPSAKLWCVVVRNLGTGETKIAEKEQITSKWMKNALEEFDIIIAHNGHKFDLPVLRLFNVIEYSIGYLGEKDTLFGRSVSFVDSLILSRLLEPDRRGGHSLKIWGERVGEYKDNFRKESIEQGIIPKEAKQGAEFQVWSPLMTTYCVQDTNVTGKVFEYLLPEYLSHPEYFQASRQEHKLADLAIKRESLGFWFDKDLAIKCVEDLTFKMSELQDKVNPKLPLKLMNKTELSKYEPPKVQLKKDGSVTATMSNFALKHGAEIEKFDDKYYFKFEEQILEIPFTEPIKTKITADISNLDHVKSYLIHLGWEPTEWAIRDLTKDTKKQSLALEKRISTLDRWFKETMEGKYKRHRLEALEGDSIEDKYSKLYTRLTSDFPVRVNTSPKVRVGIEKELCPNLEALGEKVDFAKDFALYLTYKHRKSSIAGGDLEDVDYDSEYPNTGFLANYREADSRVPTPAMEIGANTFRYKHIGICNIARPSSIYGKEMRSLFGCGEGAVQLGYDFASLEARIQGNFCWDYTDGKELSVSLLAEKPNDIHSVMARKLNISRPDSKSFNYMLMYGGSWRKAKLMLGVSDEKAKELVEEFWEAMPALKEFKEDLELEWEANGKKFVRAIDGRKLHVRSKHSLVNLVFQSGGVICAKYVAIMLMQKLENMGYCIDPFEGNPDICSMIEYHDEQQLRVKEKIIEYERFSTKEEAESFVNNWTGKGQLSDISKGKQFYIALPNPITLSIEEAIKEMGELLKLNVPLGYAFSVSNNWYGCH